MNRKLFQALVLLAGIFSAITGYPQPVTLTIIYDNYRFTENTTTDWGFSCLIEGTEKNILFDAGQKGSIQLQNMDSLKIGMDRYDLIVISHNHRDHTGGLDAVLDRKAAVPVWFGASFPESFSQHITQCGATPVRVNKPVEICDRVYSTGEMTGVANEQSLILDTDSGLVIITGCAHPGILNILKKAKEVINKDIYMVLGGFHLLQHNDGAVNEIIDTFRMLGVRKCGPTHCTGDRVIALFREAYGSDYIQAGTGRVIRIP